MSEIVVNGDKLVKGRFTINRGAQGTAEGVVIVTQGTLITHKYFETITSLETNRYKIEGIDVTHESFGSDDFSIIYQFSAKRIVVKFDESDLSESEIDAIEDKLYGGDHE